MTVRGSFALIASKIVLFPFEFPCILVIADPHFKQENLLGMLIFSLAGQVVRHARE